MKSLTPSSRTAAISLSIILNYTFQGNQPVIPWQKALNYQTSEIFPITIGKYGYPYVVVSVNGQKVNLAWDTGNMSGLALNSDIARQISLPVIGESKHYDSSGEVVGIYRTYHVRELNAFGKAWTNEQAHEIRTNDLDGLIGPRFVLGKRFTLDYQNKVIAVSDSPLPREESEEVTLPMVSSPGLTGLILVWGSLTRRKVLIQIDTGKSRTCVDPSLVASIGLPEVGNGYRINELRMGPYSFSVPSAKKMSFKGISEGLPEPILLGVGSDILSQVVLSVDYSQKVVRISK